MAWNFLNPQKPKTIEEILNDADETKQRIAEARHQMAHNEEQSRFNTYISDKISVTNIFSKPDGSIDIKQLYSALLLKWADAPQYSHQR